VITRKIYYFMVGVLSGAMMCGVSTAAIISPVSGSLHEQPSLAQRIADKKLWLGNKSSDSSAYLSVALHGVGRRFVETGAYDVSVYAKGAKFMIGFPECKQCYPVGFFSSIDLETYLSATPFWIGVRNLGGGFGLHRHKEYKNQMPEYPPSETLQVGTLRHMTLIREQVAAIVLSPAVVSGATFGGNWGGIDIALGIEPCASAVNQYGVSAIHSRFFCETYGYSLPLRYKKLSARLFCGGHCAVSAPGVNREWGLRLLPGIGVSGMAGIQSAWSFLRFGAAFGYHFQGGTRTAVRVHEDYMRRMHEYEREQSMIRQVQFADRLVSGAGTVMRDVAMLPLNATPNFSANSITTYCAATWRRWTVGLSGQYEWNWSRRMGMSHIRLTLGYAL
jgi:hypothetical protein